MSNCMGVSKTVDGRVDLFGHDGQAKMYREFRPDYPQALIESIISRVDQSSRRVFVDIACGSGQLTTRIAPSFVKSFGFDQSEEQLKHAPKPAFCDIVYEAGSAFNLPLASESVDLVTVGQALHWLLPYQSCFEEIDRVLKPGGVFVAAAYAFPQLVNASANAPVQEFYGKTLGGKSSPGDPGCWWETNRPTIDSFYADVPFPRVVEVSRFTERVSMPTDRFFNYLRTLSAYRTLLRAGNADPLPAIEASVTRIVGGSVEVDIPFFTVSFRK